MATHQETLEQAAQQTDEELRRRLAITDYHDPDYVPSEVLVSMVKLRFRKDTRLLDAIVPKLHGRIVAMVRKFFSAGTGFLRGGDAVQEEAVSSVWVEVATDQTPVGQGFAEQRFGMFVRRRLVDFVRQARAEERGTVLLSQLAPQNVEGDQVPFEENIEGDEDDGPESEAQRNQLRDRLMGMLVNDVRDEEKQAVYYRLEQGYPWKTAAKFMNCTIPTARKYYASGVKRLLEELDDGPEND